jgi:peptidoglycan/xylan/chitin deacetylase (PgdA/CDA1 family)
MGSGVHIRWDRVSVLLAALTVLAIVVGHAVVRAVTPEVAPVTTVAQPTSPPCPPAASEVLRTAPHQEGQRTVALTFDDGPGEWTDDILAVLAREGVPATFFVVGEEAVAAADQLREAYAAGHAVENHTWSHPYAGRDGSWDRKEIGKQMRRTNTAISDITGQPPCFFRPPQGVVPGAERAARAAGLTIALWSVDTRDWAIRGRGAAASIRTRAQAGLTEPNPVVLLHDGGGDRSATVAALPGIIDDYRRHGYTFVTLGNDRR